MCRIKEIYNITENSRKLNFPETSTDVKKEEVDLKVVTDSRLPVTRDATALKNEEFAVNSIEPET